MTIVTVQRLIGRAAILDSGRGKVYPFGPWFEFRPDSEHLKHRAAYTFVQAQEVADWVNGNDRPLSIVAREVDPFDPVQRQRHRGVYGRQGLTPLPDSK